MRRMVLLAFAVILAACGGGSPATGGPASTDTGAGPAATAATADPGAVDPGSAAPGGNPGFAGQPSGAKVRIFNAYTDPVGTGVGLDLYPVSFITEATAPLLTVPYGTLSPVFDPLKSDDAGNSFLTAYVSGEFGNGNEVMGVTNTLTGTEVITYLVARGTGEMGNGRAGAISEAVYDPSAGGSSRTPPPAGKGRVLISATGLDQTIIDDVSWSVSFGDGCTLGPDDTEYASQLVSPGTSGSLYELKPATYTMSLHTYVSGGEIPTCKDKPVFEVQVPVEDGKVIQVFLWAKTPDALQAAVIPLSVP
jgi:hypothetical protein